MLARLRQRRTCTGMSLVEVLVAMTLLAVVMALEDELANARARIAELEARLDAMREEMEARIEGVHREYRRELVPLRSATVMRFETRR